MKKKKVRLLSIRQKFMMISGLCIVAISLGIGLMSYATMQNEMLEMAADKALAIATLASKNVDGDQVSKLTPGSEGKGAYLLARNALQEIQQGSNVKYIYTLYTDGVKVYYGVDADASEEACAIGEEFSYDYEYLRTVFENGENFPVPELDEEDGECLVTSYVPLYSINGYIVGALGVDCDATDIKNELSNLQMFIMLVMALGITVSLLILFVSTGRIVKSIAMVNDKLDELVNSDGDLTQTLVVKTGDEMEVMGGRINDLLSYIRSIMLNVAGNAGALNTASEEMLRDMTSVKEDIVDVSATMQEMNAATEETAASVTHVSESVSVMNDAIKNMADSAKQGTEYTADINVKANEIRENAIAEQLHAKELSKEMAKRAGEAVERSKAVEEIETLTGTILDIADQTNLLALNASIEAARAGEAGRGFAVVAGEIGTLAQNSASAAERIKQVSQDVLESVNALAEEAGQMVSFIETKAMDGYDKLVETCDSYQKDSEALKKTMEYFESETTNLRENVVEVNQAMKAVDLAMEENAKGVTEVSETMANLTESMVNLEGQAATNESVAEELNNEVHKFKLD